MILWLKELSPYENCYNFRGKKWQMVFLLISLTLVSCVKNIPMDWQATEGSRADGVVKLSIQYGIDVNPILNEQQAINEATRRCKVWGYTDAEAFGGVVKNVINGVLGFIVKPAWIAMLPNHINAQLKKLCNDITL